MSIQPRHNRRRSARHSQTYREPDSDSEFEVEINTEGSKPRPTRSSRRIRTYREDSTTDSASSTLSESESSSASSYYVAQVANTQSNGTIPTSRRSQRIQAVEKGARSRHSLNNFKRQKIGHSKHIHTKPQMDGKVQKDVITDHVASLPTNLQAPPWQTLEYDILLRIMKYAAYPLYTSTFRSRTSIEWLVSMSMLCKSFYDAATAALLWEPPLLPVFRAHGLLRRLSQDQDTLTTNYQTKIRSLRIEVKHLLVKKSGIDLANMLRFTPLLSHLRIFHGHDEMIGKAIWAEPTIAHLKWSYGNLFDELDNHNIRLQSFEWNGRFQDTTDLMPYAHTRSCLRDVQEISITNLNFVEKQEDERVRIRNIVVSSLSSLKSLRALKFRNCTILDTSAMSQLPVGLQSLAIVNCLSLTSEGVGSYLTLGGITLRELLLENNQVMDLAFIPRLSELCPHLEYLHVDLSYDDCSSYRDRNPLYDDLLPNGSPTWPSSLVSIIIGPLRQLDLADAEAFYSSLIDAAGDLPFLRTLIIRSILAKSSWRDRASLRIKWRPLFEKVFSANKNYVPAVPKPKPKPKSETSSNNAQRKSARLQELDEVSNSDDVEESNEVLQGTMPPRQNRCEIVEFELSDQRPAQEQYREDDFLDSEPSGDDEWNGQDQAPQRAGYAW